MSLLIERGKMKLLHLDFETSSLDSWKGAILEVGAIACAPGKEQITFHKHLQPHIGAVVEDAALRVNNTTRDDLTSSERLLPGAGFNAFIDFLATRVDPYKPEDKFFLVAYNAPFDLGFLEQWFKRNNNKWFGSYFWRPPLCTYALSAFHLGAEWAKLPDRKLATVADRLGIAPPETGNLHTALYDCLLSKGIYEKINEWHRREM